MWINPLKTEFLLTYKNSARNSQKTQYVSATNTSRLMLLGETVAAYFENKTEHTKMHYLDTMQHFSMLKQVIRTATTGL
jgi:tRNA U34 5-carboxymethylaminomethyl modifying GTPase MnmE/TrmE